MRETEIKYKRVFGLLGNNISYSFSKNFFTNKFEKENITDAVYRNFDVNSVEKLFDILKNQNDLKGLNVTIPYKEQIIPFLDSIDETAKQIGAVNTIKILKNKKLKGFNTDAYGFKNALTPLLKKQHQKALILGTGGAAKAVAFVLYQLKIEFFYVSRKPKNKDEILYSQLDEEIMKSYLVIINCTPLGTFPNTKKHPEIPYRFINNKHILFDLIYNPTETTFLSFGKKNGATTKNGMEMLELQAEKSWEIWNS